MSPKRCMKQTVIKRSFQESPERRSDEDPEINYGNESNASSANNIDEDENSAIDLIAQLLNQQKMSDKSLDKMLIHSKQGGEKGPSTQRERVYSTASKNSNPFNVHHEEPVRKNIVFGQRQP